MKHRISLVFVALLAMVAIGHNRSLRPRLTRHWKFSLLSWQDLLDFLLLL